MEDFKDIENEITKLKKELDSQDDLLGHFQFPEVNDYWKRRLDEEKILMHRKLGAKDEEKKALEARLSQQETQIEQYNQVLRDFEKKMEHEARMWEDKLRIKEADVLIEKNRLLSEDKIREAGFENHKLLVEIGEINAKINEIKEANALEINRLNENFEREREVFAEKLNTHRKELELLNDKTIGLEAGLLEKALLIEELHKQLEAQKNESQNIIMIVTTEKNSLEKNISILKNELTDFIGKSQNEKKTLENAFNDEKNTFVNNMRTHLGPVVGLARFISNNKADKKTWDIFEDIIHKVEDETDVYSGKDKSGYLFSEPFKAVLVLTETDMPAWQEALALTRAEIVELKIKNLEKNICTEKPRVIVISSGYLKCAKKIQIKFPFLPILLSGEIMPSRTKSLTSLGFNILRPPYVTEEISTTMVHTAYNSIAREEYWGKIKLGRSYMPYALAAALLFACAALFMNKMPLNSIIAPQKVIEFQTPYLRPTNITYDGQYLWASDWFGQCIYKHRINGELGLDRIFYFPGQHFAALAWHGGNMWSADPWEAKIYKHNTDENMTILKSFSTPGNAPSGIALDGKFFWSCDSSEGKIYRHKMDDKLTVVNSYKTPGSSPSGLFYDGKHLWSIDSKTNKIYRHKMDDKLSVDETYLPKGYEEKGFNLSGIAKMNGKTWICSEKSGKIFQYASGQLKKVDK